MNIKEIKTTYGFYGSYVKIAPCTNENTIPGISAH